MATELAPIPGHGDVTASKGADVVDITLLELEPAPEAVLVPGTLHARVSRPTRRVGPPALSALLLAAAAVLLPAVLLLAVLQLPLPAPQQGAALVAGWTALAVLARHLDRRHTEGRPR